MDSDTTKSHNEDVQSRIENDSRFVKLLRKWKWIKMLITFQQLLDSELVEQWMLKSQFLIIFRYKLNYLEIGSNTGKSWKAKRKAKTVP